MSEFAVKFFTVHGNFVEGELSFIYHNKLEAFVYSVDEMDTCLDDGYKFATQVEAAVKIEELDKMYPEFVITMRFVLS